MKKDIKIYFDDRVVVLTGKGIKYNGINNNLIYIFENKKTLAKRLEHFEESGEDYLCITHTDIDELFACTAACYKYVEAAGGLVTLPDGRMLVIKRLGKWDLPKGKAEKGESLQETAIREVVEECGLKSDPIITRLLTHTYHVYRKDGNRAMKHTAWFAMSYDGDDTLRPQIAENITDAVWIPENRLDMVLQNTYESIRQVLDDRLPKNDS